MKQRDLIKYFLLFLLTFLIIDYSPLILSKDQPDSENYLNLHASRQVTYYFIIKILNTIGLDLFFFQKFLLSLSITCLFLLIKKTSKYLFVLTNFFSYCFKFLLYLLLKNNINRSFIFYIYKFDNIFVI